MKRIIVILVLLTFIVSAGFSQQLSNLDSLIFEGKKLVRTGLSDWSEANLLSTRAYCERLLFNYPDSWLVHYYLGLADSRLVSLYFSQNVMEKAKPMINEGIEHLQKAIKGNKDFADAHSLLSSLYGNKIATAPLLGMSLGPKSGVEMQKAIALQPANPRNYLIAGWSAYFTPKMWGGGKDKAKKNYERAVLLFDSFKVEHPVYPDWGHEEVYAWLGLLSTELKEFEQAEVNYQKALAINPDYSWVKFVLLPELEKAKAENK